MSLLPDILRFIERTFPPERRAHVVALLEAATLHDGTPASPRCQRAALIGSRGSIERLEELVALLKIDCRDVIVAGEYEVHDKSLRQVRDLNAPISCSTS